MIAALPVLLSDVSAWSRKASRRSSPAAATRSGHSRFEAVVQDFTENGGFMTKSKVRSRSPLVNCGLVMVSPFSISAIS